MARFTIKLEAVDYHPVTKSRVEAWSIQDKAARDFNMPARACAVNMSKQNAQKVADILNEEWQAFCAHPW